MFDDIHEVTSKKFFHHLFDIYRDSLPQHHKNIMRQKQYRRQVQEQITALEDELAQLIAHKEQTKVAENLPEEKQKILRAIQILERKLQSRKYENDEANYILQRISRLKQRL